ncbi:MAG: 16S rRNA (cytosine(967)-C(5))-methyltransferase RsmB [Nitrospirota bacterium]
MSNAGVEQPTITAGRVTPARAAALAALLQIDAERMPAQTAIEAAARGVTLSAEDRAFLNELVNGVLRHRLHLDWALQQVAHETPYTAQPVLRHILRLGAYQVVYLDRVPDYAAIDQSVELVKLRLGPPSAPLANALLRELAKRHAGLIVPDLLDQPIEHIAVRYSHPRWLVKRWVKRYGAQRTITLCRANNEPPPLTVRVNRLKLSVAEYQRLLHEKGVVSSPCAVSPLGLRIEHGGPVAALPGYAAGWFYVQDEASQLVVLLLAPRPGDRVLDACAAPGGKTTQIAELMRDQGEILALDRSPERLSIVEANAKRLGLATIRTMAADATQPLPPPAADQLDRVLVDAPCSGLGVLRRHPEGKWAKDENSIAKSAQTARKILSNAALLLKPKGVLVYSTCSTEPEENQEVVQEFLSRHRNFRLEDPRPLLPASAGPLFTGQGYLSTVLKEGNMDGFFAARLVKVK